MSAPNMVSLIWRDWQPAWGLDAVAALSGLLYWAGARQVTGGWPRLRTASFLAGIGCVVVATQSGIDAFDDRLLSDHMVQHLLLLELVPLLLLGGRPAMVLLRATPRSRRPALARRLMRLRLVTRPVTCLAFFWLVLGVTHLPIVFDATLRHSGLHEAEHALFLTAGMVMWWPVLDGDPLPAHRLDGVMRLVYVMAAMLPMTLLGGFLDRDTSLLYAGYAAPAHALGISAIADQQQAGAIMWVLGTTLMIGVGIWQAMAALVAKERRHQTHERHASRSVLAGRGPEA